ncbi:hypothetical protein [Thalassotalea sediminis]|uniref:hypothetical protein n=1 Tax=Thalassotalea sediminis TaxID=1759089 RepID=UPI0025735E6D|nr:hypothetical protein [Thalassotalea sediminis]
MVFNGRGDNLSTLRKVKLLLVTSLFSMVCLGQALANNLCDQFKIDTWQRLCPTSKFCFSHPKWLTPQHSVMIDSVAGVLQGEQLVLTYELGQYINNFANISTKQRQLFSYNGAHAVLITTADKIAYLHKHGEGLLMTMSLAKGANNNDDLLLSLPLAKCLYSTVYYRTK